MQGMLPVVSARTISSLDVIIFESLIVLSPGVQIMCYELNSSMTVPTDPQILRNLDRLALRNSHDPECNGKSIAVVSMLCSFCSSST